MEERETLKIFTMTALALEHIHNQGQVHRNLSSAHVLIDNESTLAKLLSQANIPYKRWREKRKYMSDEEDSVRRLSTENFYISPDVASDHQEYTQADDVWALGMLLYEMTALHLKPTYRGNDSGPFGYPFSVKKIEAGEHLQVGERHSVNIINLLNALLQVDKQKRPTVKQILLFPGVIGEVIKLQQSA